MNKPLDSVTITTVWSYFWRVCREMRETVERTATNVLIVTLHDLAYTIYDADGNALAVPEGIPHRLLSPKLGVKHIREKFGDDIHPGDVFLANTPDDGAAHLPDWVYIRPVFCGGELTFFAVMGVHVADNGGAQPGSNFMSFDNISEGFNIPLSRIVKGGEWNNEVFDVIMANNRLPDLMRRESSACIGSLAIGNRRLTELCEKYGRETVVACTREMMDRAEAAVRKQIESWPDGTWYAEASADSDGKDLTKPITVRASLTVKGSDLYFDFSDTDPETDGMLNIHDYMTYSDCCCNSFLFFGRELLTYHNEGSCRPIHMKTRPGTLVDASRTAKIAAGVALTGGLVNEVIQNLLSQVLPEKAIAPYSRQVTSNIITMGRPGVFVSFSASASAAGKWMKLLPFFAVPGSIFGGWLDQKVGTRRAGLMMGVGYIISGVCGGFLPYNSVTNVIFVFMFFFMTGSNANMVMSHVMSLYGPRDYPVIWGRSAVIMQIFTVTAPIILSTSLRLTNGYRSAYAAFAIASLVGTILIFFSASRIDKEPGEKPTAQYKA